MPTAFLSASFLAEITSISLLRFASATCRAVITASSFTTRSFSASAAFARAADPESGIYDENAVEFRLESGTEAVKYQSDAIFASAVLRASGEAIPLNCSWYNIPIADGKDTGLNLI